MEENQKIENEANDISVIYKELANHLEIIRTLHQEQMSQIKFINDILSNFSVRIKDLEQSQKNDRY